MTRSIPLYIGPLIILAVTSYCKYKEPQPKATEVTPAVKEVIHKPSQDEFAAKALASPSQQPQTVAGKYHGNAKTHVLHGPKCPAYNCPNCVIGFRSVREARRKGYKPHSCITSHRNRISSRPPKGPR